MKIGRHIFCRVVIPQTLRHNLLVRNGMGLCGSIRNENPIAAPRRSLAVFGRICCWCTPLGFSCSRCALFLRGLAELHRATQTAFQRHLFLLARTPRVLCLLEARVRGASFPTGPTLVRGPSSRQLFAPRACFPRGALLPSAANRCLRCRIRILLSGAWALWANISCSILAGMAFWTLASRPGTVALKSATPRASVHS